MLGDILAFIWVLYAFPKVLIWLIYKRKEREWEEDALDIRLAREAIAESEKEGFVSWEEIRKGLEEPDFKSEE